MGELTAVASANLAARGDRSDGGFVQEPSDESEVEARGRSVTETLFADFSFLLSDIALCQMVDLRKMTAGCAAQFAQSGMCVRREASSSRSVRMMELQCKKKRKY